MKWIKTLKFRLIITMMSLVMLTIVIIAVSIISNQRQAIKQQAQNDLTSLSEVLVTNTLSSILFNDQQSAQQTLDALRVRPDINQAVIYTETGEEFANYHRGDVEHTVTAAKVSRLLERKQLSFREDAAGLHIFIPMISHGEVVGLLYLLDDLATLHNQLNAFYRLVLITVMVALIASLVAMVWLVSLFTSPLNQLLMTIREITSKEDYTKRAPAATTREFNQLTRSFNKMIYEVQKRGEQLSLINAELEQRVQARTEALETALQLANEANKAKAEFLAVMSHEVRTPLNGVIGFAELLKLHKLDSDAEETVQLLNESAHNLLQLLNQILDFSKLDADKVELEQQRFSLNEFLTSVIETNRGKADRKGLELVLTKQEIGGDYSGDSLRLRQILNNLIDNAIKFTDQGSVSLGLTELFRDGEHWLKFEVTDTGIGISEDELQNIFSPFAQADSSVTRRYGGTGLGLAICTQLIQLMRGEFGVNSERGKGSVFWFMIPIRAVAETVAPSAAQPTLQPPSGNGKRILLAEDNEVNQSVASGILTNLGYQVEIVVNGSEAVSRCQQQKYDLILMDYHMPVMGGLEATTQIRSNTEQRLNNNTPIIALTADVQANVETQFRHAGADDLLTKPFTLQQLDSCLDKWLNLEQVDREQQPVIDESVLKEIQALSGEQDSSLIDNIVELYLQRSPSLIQEIHLGTQEGNAEQVFKAAHALKSSSANIGAIQVSEIARQIEKLGRDNRIEQAQRYIDKLTESYEQARLTLKGRMGEA